MAIVVQHILLILFLVSFFQISLNEPLNTASHLDSNVHQENTSDCDDNYDINYLKLGLTWAPGACAAGKFTCQSSRSVFTIHGLWPQFKYGASPMRECCSSQKFNKEDLVPFYYYLRDFWPSLSRINDDEFWLREWNKHGKCANKIQNLNTVSKYFSFALDNYLNLWIKDFLMQNGVIPSNDVAYKGRDIAKLLEDHYGSKFELNCAPLRNNPSKNLLTGINICFNNDLRMIDCWVPHKRRDCLGEIVFLDSV